MYQKTIILIQNRYGNKYHLIFRKTNKCCLIPETALSVRIDLKLRKITLRCPAVQQKTGLQPYRHKGLHTG